MGNETVGYSILAAAGTTVQVNAIRVFSGRPAVGATSSTCLAAITAVTSTGAIGSTIDVVSTDGFPSSGTLYVMTSAGLQTVTYGGISGGNSFTSCTGGTGNLSAGGMASAGAPTAGSWYVGDKVLNPQPAAGGCEGWICVASGTPGTWKAYGQILA
jgi:hypothetical protein